MAEASPQTDTYAKVPSGPTPCPAADRAPTKSADEENFPVGSWLLPAHLRAHIATYYAFARAVDDIADDPARAAEVKITELDAMEAALRGHACPADPDGNIRKAMRLNVSMRETGVPFEHGADLCIAFRQDAVKSRYADWDELMHYCRYSAAPVGRYLLDLHGETRDTWPASDALCASLQVINHLQDCRQDYLDMDRVYLPLDSMAAANCEIETLSAPAASPAMRAVLDQALDGVDRLNETACALPGLIRDRRMRLEAAVIVDIAHRLARLLRARDPIAARVELGRGGKLACLIGGIWRAL